MATTTAPRPDTTAPRASAKPRRVVPAEDRQLREELVASALLLLALAAVAGGVVGLVSGVLWLLS